MSRWFPERLAEQLTERLASLRPRTLTLRVDGDAAAGATAQGVEAGLATLAAELDRLAPPRGTRLAILLGGELCRLRVLPWNAALRNDSQRLHLAEHGFVQAHGEVARDWVVCLEGARHGQHSLACAIERRWIDGLSALAAMRGLRLQRVTPALVGLHRAVRAQLARQARGAGVAAGAADASAPHWLVLAEARSTTLLLCGDDGVRQVRRVATPVRDAAAVIARLLDREWIAQGLEGPRGAVAWIGSGLDAGTPVPGWSVTRLALPETADAALLIGAAVPPAAAAAHTPNAATPALA